MAVLGLWLSIIGLFIAVAQLARTASATDSAVTALEGAQSRLGDNHLIHTAGQVRHHIDDLHHLVDYGRSKAEVATCLVQYLRACAELIVLLESEGYLRHKDLSEALISSRQSARRAKAILVEGGGKPVAEVVAVTRRKMQSVDDESTQLIAQYKLKVK
jgi:uncharacterized protein YbaP (TraB family)